MSSTRSPIDPRPDREFWKEQHRRGVEWPLSWLVSAESLERSTEILWEQDKRDVEALEGASVGDPTPAFVTRVAMLLAALTIENLLKGICVAREPARNQKGEFQIKTHKLLDLADRADVELRKEENDLLESLEAFIEWAGRYPRPLRYEDMLPRTLRSGGFGPLGGGVSGGDIKVWRELVHRLGDRLRSSISAADSSCGQSGDRPEAAV